MGSGAATFVTARSACRCTVVVAVPALFAALLSEVLLAPVAVFVSVEPSAADGLTCTTTVKVADALAGRVATVHDTVPVPPAGGFVQVKAGPAVCVSDTNVVPAGSTSLRATACASLVPVFDKVIVYVRFVPAT